MLRGLFSRLPWNPRIWGDDRKLRGRLIARYPELEHAPDRHWRWVLEGADDAKFKSSQWWQKSTIVTCMAVLGVLWLWLFTYNPDWLPVDYRYKYGGSVMFYYPEYAAPMSIAVAVAIAWPFGYVPARWILLRKARQRFEAFKPVCVECGYTLIGLEPGESDGRPCVHCPECDRGIWLDIALSPADLDPVESVSYL